MRNKFIEEISRQFNIPIDEAEKRMKKFIGDIPEISDKTRQKIKEAIKFNDKKAKKSKGKKK